MKQLNLNKLLSQALDLHRNGSIDKADEIYLEILKNNPDNFDSNHLHGVVLAQKKDFKTSTKYYEKAYKINKNNCELLNNYGISLKNIKNYQKCEDVLNSCISIDASFVKSYINLGNCYAEQKKYDEALKVFNQGRKIDSSDIRFTKNIIGIYLEKFSKYKNKDDLSYLIDNLNQIDINETFDQKTICNYALAYLWNKDLDKSYNLFKIAEKKSQIVPELKTLLKIKDKSILSHFVKHEYEQICHIDSDIDGIRNMKITQDFFDSLAMINSKSYENYSKNDLNFISTIHKIKYNKPPKTKSSLLNPMLDFKSIQNEYCNSDPKICVVDNLLTNPFYTDLNVFYRCANIFKRPYPRGYVGTFLKTGMANKPILQFSLDLKNELPDIFKEYNLSQAWAFKYDSQQKGINIHADNAIVNVNLWLTPDSANLDKNSGGLIIWKKKPDDLAGFEEFNSEHYTKKMFKDVDNVDFIRVPYKANRAVIFDSKLYHATDSINFDSKYINRRLNVTFLYS
jgi:tetratricopeptide (TPR) repeat protein